MRGKSWPFLSSRQWPERGFLYKEELYARGDRFIFMILVLVGFLFSPISLGWLPSMEPSQAGRTAPRERKTAKKISSGYRSRESRGEREKSTTQRGMTRLTSQQSFSSHSFSTNQESNLNQTPGGNVTSTRFRCLLIHGMGPADRVPAERRGFSSSGPFLLEPLQLSWEGPWTEFSFVLEKWFRLLTRPLPAGGLFRSLTEEAERPKTFLTSLRVPRRLVSMIDGRRVFDGADFLCPLCFVVGRVFSASREILRERPCP